VGCLAEWGPEVPGGVAGWRSSGPGDGGWPRCGPEDRNVIAVRSGGAQCYRRATIVGVTGRGSIELPVSQVSADAAAARPSAIAHTISD
jgi:hypothetical protein